MFRIQHSIDALITAYGVKKLYQDTIGPLPDYCFPSIQRRETSIFQTFKRRIEGPLFQDRHRRYPRLWRTTKVKSRSTVYPLRASHVHIHCRTYPNSYQTQSSPFPTKIPSFIWLAPKFVPNAILSIPYTDPVLYMYIPLVQPYRRF